MAKSCPFLVSGQFRDGPLLSRFFFILKRPLELVYVPSLLGRLIILVHHPHRTRLTMGKKPKKTKLDSAALLQSMHVSMAA